MIGILLFFGVPLVFVILLFFYFAVELDSLEEDKKRYREEL